MRGAMRDSMMCISTSRCDITNTLFAVGERSRAREESRISTLEASREVESRVVIPSRAVSRDETRRVTRIGEGALVLRRTRICDALLRMSAEERSAGVE